MWDLENKIRKAQYKLSPFFCGIKSHSTVIVESTSWLSANNTENMNLYANLRWWKSISMTHPARTNLSFMYTCEYKYIWYILCWYSLHSYTAAAATTLINWDIKLCFALFVVHIYLIRPNYLVIDWCPTVFWLSLIYEVILQSLTNK